MAVVEQVEITLALQELLTQVVAEVVALLMVLAQ
jgi:hypothetical protein